MSIEEVHIRDDVGYLTALLDPTVAAALIVAAQEKAGEEAQISSEEVLVELQSRTQRVKQMMQMISKTHRKGVEGESKLNAQQNQRQKRNISDVMRALRDQAAQLRIGSQFFIQLGELRSE